MQRKIKNAVKGLLLQKFYIHFIKKIYSELSRSSRIDEIFLFFGALITKGFSMFSGVFEKFLVGVSSCSWYPLLCGGVSKLLPDRLRHSLSITVCELPKLIHKLLFLKLEKRDGFGCVLSGLNVGLESAVGVQTGDGFMAQCGNFGSPKDLLGCQTLAKHRDGFHRKVHSRNRICK